MGIKTTHFVTREFALAAIRQRLKSLSDKQLENVLEEVIHNGFYNFWILTEEGFNYNKNLNSPTPFLDDLDNLPEYNNAY